MFKHKLLTQHATNRDTFEVLRFQPNPHKTQDDDNKKTQKHNKTQKTKYMSSTDPTNNRG